MPPIAEGFTSQGSIAPDTLFAGDFPVARRMATITGGSFARGAVLGRITASDKYTLSLSASADGSQVPDAILEEAVDASGGDKSAPILLTGEFNEAALTLGAGHTIGSVRQGLRGLSIFIRKVLAA